MRGKILIFAKLFHLSFIYDLSENFWFLMKEIIYICEKYLTEKVVVFHILTDTDSTTLKFILISDSNSDVPEEKFREIIF